MVMQSIVKLNTTIHQHAGQQSKHLLHATGKKQMLTSDDCYLLALVDT